MAVAATAAAEAPLFAPEPPAALVGPPLLLPVQALDAASVLQLSVLQSVTLLAPTNPPKKLAAVYVLTPEYTRTGVPAGFPVHACCVSPETHGKLYPMQYVASLVGSLPIVGAWKRGG